MNNSEKKNIRVLHRNLLIFHIRYTCNFISVTEELTFKLAYHLGREPYENQSSDATVTIVHMAIGPDWKSLTIYKCLPCWTPVHSRSRVVRDVQNFHHFSYHYVSVCTVETERNRIITRNVLVIFDVLYFSSHYYLTYSDDR